VADDPSPHEEDCGFFSGGFGPFDDDDDDDHHHGGEASSLPVFQPDPAPKRRRVEPVVTRRDGPAWSVATLKREIEAMLRDGHGLKVGDRPFLRRIETEAIQPYAKSREKACVIMPDKDWLKFNTVRRRAVEARCFSAFRRFRRPATPPRP
jgi:hypothetical protein